MIKKLNQNTAEDLCAQQVITSLPDCIKELVDNSIDAHSTRIKIYLNDYGKKSIEVSDNGTGIQSFDFIGRKGSTSKNKQYQTIISTLGFRGQALHSLAKVSRQMIISTKHASHPPVRYDVKSGKSVAMDIEKPKGTTVYIQSLFQLLPVRRYQMASKFREYLKKTDEMIREYTLAYPEISFILINRRDGNDDLLIETTQHEDDSRSSWGERIEEMLGNKIASNLIFKQGGMVEGWMLKNIESGSGRDNLFVKKQLQFMYLHKRPINPIPQVRQFLDSVYRKYNKSTKFIYILNVKADDNAYDLNLTPNKREIMLVMPTIHKIIEELKAFIEDKVVAEIPSMPLIQEKKIQISKPKIQQIRKPIPQPEAIIIKQKEPLRKPQQIKINAIQSGKVEEVRITGESKIKQKPKDMKSVVSSLNSHMLSRKSTSQVNFSKDKKQQEIRTPKSQKKIVEKSVQNVEQRPEQKKEQSIQKQKIEVKIQKFEENTIKEVKKENFKQFQIVGQFNRGFILCLFNNKFYLVDQHAASQKYHFQKIMNTSPQIMRPNQHLTLDPLQIDALQNNYQQLQSDGYGFEFLSDNEVVLKKVPVSLGKIYGKQYFLQLIDKKIKLKEHEHYYSAAATKACRTAVMVGHVLEMKEMQSIVRELGNLESPWNCPHGRPTLMELGPQPIAQDKDYKL